MGKVENNENPGTNERSYLAGYVEQRPEDEIDLVDLWIVMWSHRKLFLSSAILVVVIGILCFELFYSPKSISTVRSIIEIESIILDGNRISILDPGVLTKRIEIAKLPRFSSLSEFQQIKPSILTTTASPGSNIVEIGSKLPTGDMVDLSRFHGQLVDEILMELNASAQLLKAGIQESLFSVKSRIVSLKGMLITLEQGSSDGVNSGETSNRLKQEEIALRRSNFESEIEILTERMKYLETTLSKTGSRVLLKAGVQENSKGLAKPVAYTMILILSLILALFVTMGVIFARKVKERMATES